MAIVTLEKNIVSSLEEIKELIRKDAELTVRQDITAHQVYSKTCERGTTVVFVNDYDTIMLMSRNEDFTRLGCLRSNCIPDNATQLSGFANNENREIFFEAK